MLHKMVRDAFLVTPERLNLFCMVFKGWDIWGTSVACFSAAGVQGFEIIRNTGFSTGCMQHERVYSQMTLHWLREKPKVTNTLFVVMPLRSLCCSVHVTSHRCHFSIRKTKHQQKTVESMSTELFSASSSLCISITECLTLAKIIWALKTSCSLPASPKMWNRNEGNSV